MPTIRTITDPRELVLAQLDEVRAGNDATRWEIKRLRSVLKAGQEEAQKLRDELVRLACTKTTPYKPTTENSDDHSI